MAVPTGSILYELLIRPLQTTDASGKHFELLTLEADQQVTMQIFIQAGSVAGNCHDWILAKSFKKVGAANTIAVGATTTLHNQNDAGGAAWTAAITTSAGTDRIILNVVGAAATVINWSCCGYAHKSNTI